jgi:hypothetical protein
VGIGKHKNLGGQSIRSKLIKINPRKGIFCFVVSERFLIFVFTKTI